MARRKTAVKRSRGRAGRSSTAVSGRRRERRTLASRLSRISPRFVIIAILAVVFVAFAFGPTMRNLGATSLLKKKEAELRQQRSLTDDLDKQVKEARSLRYVEAEARRQRMVFPGEVLYLVSSEDEANRVEYRVKSLQSMDEAWERVRQMVTPPSTRGGGE